MSSKSIAFGYVTQRPTFVFASVVNAAHCKRINRITLMAVAPSGDYQSSLYLSLKQSLQKKVQITLTLVLVQLFDIPTLVAMHCRGGQRTCQQDSATNPTNSRLSKDSALYKHTTHRKPITIHPPVIRDRILMQSHMQMSSTETTGFAITHAERQESPETYDAVQNRLL